MLVGPALLMLFIQFASSVPGDWTDCPHACQCKWISGKKTAICREAGFTSVPTLNADMQVIDISGNPITRLGRDAFCNIGLIHLQRIFLRNGSLFELDKDAFHDLKILIEVDLSDNAISHLHPETFAGNERLRALYMNGNPIQELKKEQFPRLPHLKSLEFQHCEIKHVHRDAFVHVSSLESLSLNGNQLTTITEAVFASVSNLKTLVLDGNPWECDCELRNFRNWILQSKLYSHSLKCARPAISKNKFWEDVDPIEFACGPRSISSESVIQGTLYGNVTLKCHVTGDPEPTVIWLFNGLPLENETLTSQDINYNIDEMYNDSKHIKWSTVVMNNVTEMNAGEYTCRASNLRGESSSNISLLLPKEAVATTLKKDESWITITAASIVAGVVSILSLLMLTCICQLRKRSSKKCRKKSNHQGSTNFSDQDKKLLDGSISTTDRHTGSCDFGSQQEMEMTEHSVQSIPLEMRDQPVHITIESHAPDPSVSVFSQPPEFSTSILPHGAYGNIFISVSVQDPHYPDIVDVSKKQEPYFATLPRRRPVTCLKEETISRISGTRYDNMGPRITADGSSTISLPETISMEDIPSPPPSSPMPQDFNTSL